MVLENSYLRVHDGTAVEIHDRFVHRLSPPSNTVNHIPK